MDILMDILFILAFAILGAGIKYIDDAFDKEKFSKNKAILLAPLLAIFWAYVMALNIQASTILFAIILSVLLTGKIDNIAHLIGLASILSIAFFANIFNFLLLPLVVLTVFGIVDEIGNDLSKNIFFKYRMSMKLACFGLAIFGYLEFVFFFAFLGFDIAYHLVAVWR